MDNFNVFQLDTFLEVNPFEGAVFRAALAEVISTPEMQAILPQLQAASSDNQIVIHHDRPHFDPNSFEFGVNVGGDDDRYTGVDGGLHDFSIQRSIVHEFYHGAYKLLEPKPEGSEHDWVIARANEFMEKYYGETGRVHPAPEDRLGTYAADFNNDFNYGLVEDISLVMLERVKLWDDSRLSEMSLELRSLYELREHPQAFAEQVQALKDSGEYNNVVQEIYGYVPEGGNLNEMVVYNGRVPTQEDREARQQEREGLYSEPDWLPDWLKTP